MMAYYQRVLQGGQVGKEEEQEDSETDRGAYYIWTIPPLDSGSIVDVKESSDFMSVYVCNVDDEVQQAGGKRQKNSWDTFCLQTM